MKAYILFIGTAIVLAACDSQWKSAANRTGLRAAPAGLFQVTDIMRARRFFGLKP